MRPKPKAKKAKEISVSTMSLEGDYCENQIALKNRDILSNLRSPKNQLTKQNSTGQSRSQATSNNSEYYSKYREREAVKFISRYQNDYRINMEKNRN